ncbi:MAG: helix-turn-helix transcriptional regulator [Pseudomonadota bacterium]
MTTTDHDEEIFDLIYAGVTGGDEIERALRMCIDRLEASGGNIQVTSKTDFRPLYFLGFGEGYQEETIAEYLDHWQYANAHRDAMRRAYDDNPGSAFLCHEHISEEDFQTGAYFQEFFTRIGQRWLAGGLARDARGIEVSMAFSRPLGSERFGDNDANFIIKLLPHVRRATGIAIELGLPVGTPPTMIGQSLMAAGTAAFLIDSQRKVHWQNEAGTELLKESVGLSTINDVFTIDSSEMDNALADATREALDRKLANTPSSTISIRTNNQSLELEIVPATMPRGSLIGAVALVLVMVRKRGLSATVSKHLRDEYGLTVAESSLAVMMAEGIGIDEAAERRELSPHTVRTQLRSIFSKTGVTKQTALTALVWRAS